MIRQMSSFCQQSGTLMVRVSRPGLRADITGAERISGVQLSMVTLAYSGIAKYPTLPMKTRVTIGGQSKGSLTCILPHQPPIKGYSH